MFLILQLHYSLILQPLQLKTTKIQNSAYNSAVSHAQNITEKSQIISLHPRHKGLGHRALSVHLETKPMHPFWPRNVSLISADKIDHFAVTW